MGPRDRPIELSIEDDRLLTPTDLAQFFQVGDERKIIDWTRTYSWPHIQVGRTIRFTREQRDLILAKHASLPADSPAAVGVSGQTARSRAASARKRRVRRM